MLDEPVSIRKESLLNVKNFSGNLMEIAQLAHRVYGYDAESYASYLVWKYQKNPLGVILSVCDREGKIVGAGAMMPVLMKINNDLRECAIGGDLMVLPEYRRMGIMTAVSNRNTEEARRRGFLMIYGTSPFGSPTLRGLLKSGLRSYVGDIPVLKKYFFHVSAAIALWHYPKLTLRNLVSYLYSLADLLLVSAEEFLLSSSEHLAKAIYRPRKDVQGSIEVKEIKPLVFDDEFENFCRRSQEAFPVAVARTKEYLNWRYSNPGYLSDRVRYFGFRADSDGSLCGYSVVAYHDEEKMRFAYILDIMSSSPDVAAALLRKIIRHVMENGAHVLSTWGSNVLKNEYRRAGFVRSRFGRQSVHLKVFESQEGNSVLCDISKWYVTIGDTEDWL
jgi:GNAT superfamily N-acetyltransferase